MSGVTMSTELSALAQTFGFGLEEMQWLTLNAMKSSFAPFDQRLRLINGVIKPGYARLLAEEAAGAPTLV
jgi:adenosine deaminase